LLQASVAGTDLIISINEGAIINNSSTPDWSAAFTVHDVSDDIGSVQFVFGGHNWVIDQGTNTFVQV